MITLEDFIGSIKGPPAQRETTLGKQKIFIVNKISVIFHFKVSDDDDDDDDSINNLSAKECGQICSTKKLLR